MSAAQDLIGSIQGTRSSVDSDREALRVAEMLLGKIRDELNGARPEDPLDLDAISFFVDEATCRVRRASHHMLETNTVLRDAEFYIDRKASTKPVARKRKAARS